MTCILSKIIKQSDSSSFLAIMSLTDIFWNAESCTLNFLDKHFTNIIQANEIFPQRWEPVQEGIQATILQKRIDMMAVEGAEAELGSVVWVAAVSPWRATAPVWFVRVLIWIGVVLLHQWPLLSALLLTLCVVVIFSWSHQTVFLNWWMILVSVSLALLRKEKKNYSKWSYTVASHVIWCYSYSSSIPTRNWTINYF